MSLYNRPVTIKFIQSCKILELVPRNNCALWLTNERDRLSFKDLYWEPGPDGWYVITRESLLIEALYHLQFEWNKREKVTLKNLMGMGQIRSNVGVYPLFSLFSATNKL